MKRRPAVKIKDKKIFRRSASKVKKVNLPQRVRRGGIRF